MKKTVSTNINGINFIMDEDAYILLNDYINSIKSHFNNKKGSDDIIIDIEARIAELFQLKLNDKKQVITLDDIIEIKKQMGQPSDFDSDIEDESENNSQYKSSNKRLYRDINDRIIGGVCSGLAAYFHIDTVWVRLIFLVAIFSGVSPFAYIILWIIIPAARSVSERLEMRGDPVNISNIEKSIRDEMSQMRDKIEDLAGQARDKFKKKS